MFFIKLGSGYWDGSKFIKDRDKAILYGAAAGASQDLRKAQKINEFATLTPLNGEEFAILFASFN
jgi:hypothetical protein